MKKAKVNSQFHFKFYQNTKTQEAVKHKQVDS